MNSSRSARPRLDQRGVGMLEVLIAAVILILVMFGLAQYFMRGRAHIDYEEERRKATASAQYRLDQLRRVAYDDLVSYDGVDTTFVVDGRNYKVTTTVAAGVPNTHTSTITAQVDWTVDLYTGSGAQVPRSMQVNTIRGRVFQF